MDTLARPCRCTVRVVIIEDLREVREGLTMLIDGTVGFQCVGQLSDDGGRAREASCDCRPDVILTDIGLPGMDGIDGTAILRDRFPAVPILALTRLRRRRECVQRDLRWRVRLPAEEHAAGAAAGIAAEKSSDGGAPMSPDVARRVITLFRDFRPPARASYRPDAPGNELLKLMVEGHHYKTAAREMGISTNTVSFHLKHIYEKLQVHSKTEAVAKALRERLI